MPDPSYRIYPDWKDILVYDEGEGRTLRLDSACIEPMYRVSVPSADCWLEKVPPWACERRAVILERLRAADCIICEAGKSGSSTQSPDGLFRVEVYFETDERGYLLRSIRVISNPGEVLAEFPDTGLAGLIQFPRPGALILPFESHGRRDQIEVDVAGRTFRFHPHEEPRPLDQVSNELASRMPGTPPPPHPKPPLRSLIGGIFFLLLSAMFVAAGIWQMIAGRTVREHWIGAACTVFFGLCALAPLSDLRRWFRHRRDPAARFTPASEETDR